MAQDGDPHGTFPAAADLRPVTYSPRSFIVGDDVPRVLFLIPGSKSVAQWCIDVRCAAEKEEWGIDVRVVPYSPPSLWQVVFLPWQFRSRRQVVRQLDRMFRELPEQAELFMAAHSFGTDVLTHWLRDRVQALHGVQHFFRIQQRIHGIILINGIAKRKYLADIRDACNVLINDVAVDDRVPSWAAGLAGWSTTTSAHGESSRERHARSIDSSMAIIPHWSPSITSERTFSRLSSESACPAVRIQAPGSLRGICRVFERCGTCCFCLPLLPG